MKNDKRIAIITIRPEHFNHYCTVKGIPMGQAKMVSTLKDVEGMVFLESHEIDGSENVTDYVKSRIKLISDETS